MNRGYVCKLKKLLLQIEQNVIALADINPVAGKNIPYWLKYKGITEKNDISMTKVVFNIAHKCIHYIEARRIETRVLNTSFWRYDYAFVFTSHFIF